MDAIRKVLAKDPIETFSAIKLSMQMFAEVDPAFTRKWYNIQRGPWYVLNNQDRGHLITCSKSEVNPLFTNGWSDLKQFNEFSDNIEVVFGYHGNLMFSFEMFKELSEQDELPKWHSRSTIPNETAYFDTILNESDFTSPMKTLSNDFSLFIKEFKVQDITFCADSGKEDKFEVYFLNDDKLTAKVGTKWDRFCKENQFKIGHTIHLKMNLSDNLKCHVYQIHRTSTSDASA